jgi:hypothetical protein
MITTLLSRAFFMGLHSLMALSQGADLERLRNVFQESFYTSYISGECGRNIQRFILDAKKTYPDLDLSGAIIAKFTRHDGQTELHTLIGFDTRKEKREAREAPPFPPRGRLTPLRLSTEVLETEKKGVSRWMYHVILVADGMVFDLDFTNAPSVIDLKSYFSRMFLPHTDTPLYAIEGRYRHFDEIYPDLMANLKIMTSDAEHITSEGLPRLTQEFHPSLFFNLYPSDFDFQAPESFDSRSP